MFVLLVKSISVFIFSRVTPLLRIVVTLFVDFARKLFSKLRWELKSRQDYTQRIVKSPAITPNQYGNFSDGFVLRVLETGLHKRDYISVFDVHVTVRRVKFLITKPTKCTNFSNLFLE